MRTTRDAVTFHSSFILNKDTGELPAGSYEIEIDEEEIPTRERQAFRRSAIYFYIREGGSTRTIVIRPGELDSALERDAEKRRETALGEAAAEPGKKSERNSSRIRQERASGP